MQVTFAIALFARQLGVTCEKCHTVVPHLNEFGAHFLATGERLPIDGTASVEGIPFAAKVNLVASSSDQGDGPDGRGLPKTIVDEIELFTAGALGNRASYFAEQYVVDGGEHGLLREAWINERLDPWSARIPLFVQGGSFTLPLPVDPETFRETYQDYALYVQTVGNNPFHFKEPHYGALATIGDTLRGSSARIFAGLGYDRVSGLAKTGTDVMIDLAHAAGPLTGTFYTYTGERPAVPGALDRFHRTGYALTYGRGKWNVESTVQTGFDSDADGAGVASSGGFTQLRYAFSRRFFALGRYEGTNDHNGFARDGVLLLGYGPTENSRLTIEDVIARMPQTTNTVNLQLTVGW